MLKQAKRQLGQILDTLDPDVPVVGLEPSCVAVFRDELPNLFPDARAPKVLTLAEVLADWQPPRLDRRALFHAHCHHKAVMKTFADEALLRRVVDLEILDSGCCGLAGSFGYEAGEKYEVSMAVGELALLPAVRSASDDTLVITDGFSCRQQIAHGTGRRALHLAEVLRLGL
jgi:Fe-S oxidoreductase